MARYIGFTYQHDQLGFFKKGESLWERLHMMK